MNPLWETADKRQESPLSFSDRKPNNKFRIRALHSVAILTFRPIIAYFPTLFNQVVN